MTKRCLKVCFAIIQVHVGVTLMLLPVAIDILMEFMIARCSLIYSEAKEPATGMVKLTAWDMNYTTFDFSSITSDNLENGADACFVRCISTSGAKSARRRR